MFARTVLTAGRCAAAPTERVPGEEAMRMLALLLRPVSTTTTDSAPYPPGASRRHAVCPFHANRSRTQRLHKRHHSELVLHPEAETCMYQAEPTESTSTVKSIDEMPGPRGLPGVGNLLKYGLFGPYSFEKIFENRMAYMKKYGPIYKEQLGPMKMVHLFDPEEAMKIFAKEGTCPNRGAQMAPVGMVYAEKNNKPYGLVFKNGEDWINQRKLIQKLMMHPTAANPYLRQQNAIADDFVHMVGRSLDARQESDNLLLAMMRYTMESIAGVCFNVRLGCLENQLPANSDAMRMIKAVQVHFQCLHKSTFSFPWVKYFPTPLYYRYSRAGRVMEQIASEQIKQTLRRISHKDAKEDCLMSCLARNSKMPLNEMIALTLNFFEAGIDSTAKCMTFMMYNLARNPDKQEILYKEIVDTLGESNYVTAEALRRMPYLRACMKESFRVNYPVYAGLARVLPEDIELMGYNIPKGTFIQVNNGTMCKMEKYFPEPEKYIPERWLRDSLEAKRTDSASFIMLPFGFGIRNCIGKRFAEQEILLAIVKMVKHYRMEFHHGEIGMINEIFTKPDQPVRVRLLARYSSQ